MTRADFHILVIGGGMVGAGVAALAAAHRDLAGLKIALLEAHPPAAPPDDDVELRVSAVSRASQRVLGTAGAWQMIPARHLSPYDEMIVWDAQARPHGAGSIHFSASATSEPDLGHIVENRRLQWGLYEAPAFRERITVLRAELSAFEFDSERVVAVLRDGRRVSASLVVGADGAASLSRKLAGIESHGWNYEQCAFVTHVRTGYPHQRTAWQRFLPEGPIAFLPLADGRSSIVWTTTPAHAKELVGMPPADAASRIEAALDGVLGTVEVAAPRAQFPLRLAHAKAYCRERFVLVGDAAHAVHPLAGQGVNLGFLDAAALVDVLARELAERGAPDTLAELRVLRRYERWRKSENAIALGLIDGLNRLFSTSDPLLGWARRVGLTAVNRSTLARGFFMGRAMGTRGELPTSAATRLASDRPPGYRY